MPLNKQNVSIALSQGIDTKTDPKEVVQGKLLTLNNGFFQTVGEIRKRNGYTQVGTTLSSGNAVASYNNELIALDNSSLLSFSSAQSLFNSKGNKVAVDLSVKSIIKNTFQQTAPDSAYASNLQVFVWEDTQGGVRYCVVDYTTGQLIVPNTLIYATGIKPKVKTIGSFFVIFFSDSASNNLKYVSINTSTPTVLGAAVVVAADLNSSNFNYDATALSNRLFVAYNSNAASVRIFYLSNLLVQSAVTTIAGINADKCITCFADTQLWVAFQDASLNVKYLIRDSNLGLILATTLVENTSQSRNITGYASAGLAKIFYEIVGTSNSNNYIRAASLTNLGIVSNVSTFIRSVGLASKAFSYNSNTYVVVTHESSLQSTYFLLNCSTGNISAKIAPDNGGGITTRSILPEINAITAALVQFPYLLKGNLTSVNGDIFTETGLSSASLSFGMPIVTNSIGNNLHMSGGLLSVYDGASVSEHGFNLYPEDVTAEYNYSNGALSFGQYQYSVVYEWTDNQGQIHRSAPSVPLTVTIPSSGGLLNFTGTTTTGSPIVTGINTFDGISLAISVSSSAFPANTFISAINYGAGEITLSANATTTGFANFTVTEAAEAGTNTTISTDTVAFSAPGVIIPFISPLVSGQNSLTVVDSTYLFVGMTLDGAGVAPANTTITAINGRVLTLSANLSRSSSMASFWFKISWSSTVTIGDTVITGVPHNIVTQLHLGQQIFQQFAPVGKITSIDTGLNTITIDTPLPATGTFEFEAAPPSSAVLRIGQEINSATSGLVFPAGTLIRSVDDSTYSFTISNPPTSISSTNPSTILISNRATVVLTIPTLRVTNKSGSVSIVVYRTTANGTIFYRVTSITSLLYNDTTVDTVEYVDELSDYSIIGNEQIYTTGGEVENIEVPATSITTLYKNRLIAVPSEAPLSWWFSKQVIPGSPVEFNDSFVQNVDARGGVVTAISVMDDKLIIFKANTIFYVVGDGPTPAGTNNDFSPSFKIETDTGCINKKSVVSTPIGTLYQSANGIYLLDRSLQVQYIGAEVESFNSNTITSAQLIPGVTQVRFTLDSGSCLVFDYFVKQWSVFTNINATDSCIFNNIFNVISTSGIVNKETAGIFTDNGSFIPISLVTSWLSFAGLQSYQRAYKLLLLGQYKSAHTLSIGMSYDFVSTVSHTATIPVTTAPTGAYQYRVFLNQQKCEAVQFTVTETQSLPYGEGLSLTAMAFEVGAKKGLQKVPASKAYG